MPVIVSKYNGLTYDDYYIVPAPLVSFNRQTYNNIGRPGFGADFSASLEGTIIPTHGSPYYSGGTVEFSQADWTKTYTSDDDSVFEVSGVDTLDSIIKKQEKIRWLFANTSISGIAHPMKITINGWETDNVGSGLSFYAFVDDISFNSDSRWAKPTSYTVNLRNAGFIQSAQSNLFGDGVNETTNGYLISNLSETFDIQEDTQTTLSFNGGFTLDYTNKVYNINRSITAVGSPVYDESGNYRSGLAPWQQASGFIYDYLQLGTGVIPQNRSSISGALSINGYNIANTVYQESIDREAGSYSLTETYLVYNNTYPVIETININHDISESELSSVTVNGTIQGLNTTAAFARSGNSFINAEEYWGTISTGTPVLSYYYAKNITGLDWLHPRPLSRNVSRDLNNGTITYSYNFDARPPNIIPGSVSESININDTYPGEIFSVTPVIGLSQPVLQYLNSRSEYKRSLSINVVMGAITKNWSDVNVNGSGLLDSGVAQNIVRSWLTNQKPSVTNPDEFNLIYQAANPINDTNFTVPSGRCYHTAPNESWDARTRTYTYNIEWTYTRL